MARPKESSGRGRWLVNFGLVFFTLVLVLGANSTETFLNRLGIESNIFVVGLVALAIAGLVARRNVALIVVVVVMVIAANAPPEVAESYGFDPDILLAGLGAAIVVPIIGKLFFD